MIRHLYSQPKISITKTVHHASVAVHQLFKGSFVQSFSLQHHFVTWNDHFLARDCRMGLTLQDRLERRVFRGMCCFSHLRSEAGQEACMLFIFRVRLQLPWWVPWARTPTCPWSECSICNTLPHRQPRPREAMLLELLAELALALLCQSPCWVGNKEKILRSNPMWPQFSVSCVHLKFMFKFWGNAPLCGSLSVWGDFADYKFS